MSLFLLWFLLLKTVNGSETIWCYQSNSKKTSKEKMNGMQSLVSMNPIYRKEQEVSRKETSVTFNARNMNYSFNEKGVWYMSQRNCRIHDSWLHPLTRMQESLFVFKCNEIFSNEIFSSSLLSMKYFNIEAKGYKEKNLNKTCTQARTERI
jgi:hypothetical protein